MVVAVPYLALERRSAVEPEPVRPADVGDHLELTGLRGRREHREDVGEREDRQRTDEGSGRRHVGAVTSVAGQG